jgi:hypothetical protein
MSTPGVRVEERSSVRYPPLSAAAAPIAAGLLAGSTLVGLYMGLVTLAQDSSHALELLWEDRYFVAAISSGFGLQAGLFVYLRRLISWHARGGAAAVTATGTGTSSAAMIACCAHHVADALPVLGLSGAAIFLSDYRLPVMAAGLGINAFGVFFMLRLVVLQRRRMRAEVSQ